MYIYVLCLYTMNIYMYIYIQDSTRFTQTWIQYIH